MDLAYYSPGACRQHSAGLGHPEQPARQQTVDSALRAAFGDALRAREAPLADAEALKRAHAGAYVERILNLDVAEGEQRSLDADTHVNAHSVTAARLAAGAVIDAVDSVLDGSAQRAFCNVRPPGHHAEHDRAMGFCLFNSIAAAARHALEIRGLERIVVVDFDVHFGNGTADILRGDDRVLLLSSFQFPLYPLSALPESAANEVNVALPAGSDGAAFRSEVEAQWWPRLDGFRPQLLLISAGFDAHADDPLAGLCWQAEDYAWITRELLARADAPVVSTLEGGYDLRALATSASAHVGAMLNL